MSKYSQTGFTMVELLITVAIIALMTGLALPSFMEYFEKARLRGAADDVVALLAEARQNAVRQNKQVAVSFGGAANTWCVGANPALNPPALGARIPAAVACDCTAPATCSLRAISAANYSGVTRVLVAGPTEFTFDPIMGTRSDLVSGLGIVLRSRTGRFSLGVQMSASGQARACRFAGSDGVVRIISGYRDC